MTEQVWWKGSRFDPRTVDMLREAEELCGLDLRPSQGSWSGAAASAGTHSGCGAYDGGIGMSADQMDRAVVALRTVGFAAWRRTSAQGFTPHVHAIAVQPGGKGDRGCLSGGAHDQVVDYYENRNGLASNLPDDGPRDWVGVTWEKYREESEMANRDSAVFFQKDGKRYVGYPYSGVYRHIPSPAVENDTKTVFDRMGVPWREWAEGKDVANPAAFGVLID